MRSLNMRSSQPRIIDDPRAPQGITSPRQWPEYIVWVAMRQRCRNSKSRCYPAYGGRGISVCHRWDTFLRFIDDVGPRPHPDMQLDRIDNNGDYEPGNVRWATRKQNTRNTRRTRFYAYRGHTGTAAYLYEVYGAPVSLNTVSARLKRGWSVADAFELPRTNKWRRRSEGNTGT